MKKHFLILGALIAAAALTLCSCDKELRTASSAESPAGPVPGSEICFDSGTMDMQVTRTSAITAVSGLTSVNVHAFTGTAGSAETSVWMVTGKNASSGTLSTGKYWPASDPSYRFYASNASITAASAGAYISPANCDTDWVVAKCLTPSFGSSNALAFDHILARVSTITINTQSGYELSAVSATLKNANHSGTYKLSNGAWSSLGSASDNKAGAFSGNTSAQSSSNDIWVVPGTYTLQVSYTLTKGAWTGSFTKSGSVTLEGGKQNSITATAIGGSASEISFSVSINDWGTTTLTPTLS